MCLLLKNWNKCNLRFELIYLLYRHHLSEFQRNPWLNIKYLSVVIWWYCNKYHIWRNAISFKCEFDCILIWMCGLTKKLPSIICLIVYSFHSNAHSCLISVRFLPHTHIKIAKHVQINSETQQSTITWHFTQHTQ